MRSWVVTLAMRLELRDFPLPEVPVGQLGMWDREIRLPHRAGAVANDVQVEGPWPPPLSGHPRPPPLSFDGPAVRQQIPGAERRLEQHHLIEKGPLPHGTDPRRLFDARH